MPLNTVRSAPLNVWSMHSGRIPFHLSANDTGTARGSPPRAVPGAASCRTLRLVLVSDLFNATPLGVLVVNWGSDLRLSRLLVRTYVTGVENIEQLSDGANRYVCDWFCGLVNHSLTNLVFDMLFGKIGHRFCELMIGLLTWLNVNVRLSYWQG